MKKIYFFSFGFGLFLLAVFVSGVPIVRAASFTSTQSGNLSDAATWGGSSAPDCSGGDTITVASGDTVTVDESCTLGSKAADVGNAFTINASSSSAFGTLIVPDGATLTLRGTDTSSNLLGYVGQYGVLDAQSGSFIVADLASDYGSVIKVDGNITANGAFFSIPRANVTWSNASGDQVISGITQNPWDKSNDVYVLKLQTDSDLDPGPISNAAGTDLGSMTDSSFTIVTSTAISNPVSSYASIQNNGDYYIDHSLGVMWYKTDQPTLHLTYNFDYATWFGSGIVATANTVGSAVSITNSTFWQWGADSDSVQGTEASGAAIDVDNKSAPGMTTDRVLTLTGNTFEYNTRPIQIYDLDSDSSHVLTVSGNTFNYSRLNQSFLFGNGIFDLGYSNYLTISSNTFNGFDQIFSSSPRGPFVGISVDNNTGSATMISTLPNGAVDSNFEGNTLNGFGDTTDAAAFAQGGDSSDGPDTYSGNTIGYANRAVRLDNYMVVQDNTFFRTYHHGIVFRASDGYITNLTVSGNLIYDSQNDSDFSGGWTLGYNRNQWIDNVTVDHNTFDDGTRCINFDDGENTIVLGTRLTITNNICSNSYQGIYKPANDANNVSFISLSQLDYNDDFNNTSTPSNITQATVSRPTTNAAGLTVFNPSVIDASSRTLQLISTGTAGINLALNVSWGGGTAVNLVQDQGTATGGTASTIVDTNQTWTTNAYRGYQVVITDGTGAGQYGMIISNTATQLTIIANNVNSEWSVAPGSGSTYVIVKSQISATDSLSAQTVNIGVYSPSLVLTNGTYTDSGITIAAHKFSVNPEYVNAAAADFAPTNIALHSVATNGSDIGAIEFKDVTAPSVSVIVPADGDSVSSTLAIFASATDDVGVNGVQFQIDGVNMGSLVTVAVSSTDYMKNWDTTSASNGTHTITTIAYDTSNNTSTDSISVTVVNTVTSSSTPAATVVVVGAGAPFVSTLPVPTVASTTPSVAELQSQLDALLATLHELMAEAQARGILASSTPAFTVDLAFGSKGAAVVALQNFLITQDKGSAAEKLKETGATGYFYGLTRQAVAEFQTSMDVEPSNGRFGPKTRAAANALAKNN